MSLVLDCSAALAWTFPEEKTSPIAEVYDAVVKEGAIVPAHWRLEVANSLTVAMRRRRIDAEFRRDALAALALLDITTDEHTDFHAWGAILSFADRFRLTGYDAAYLELACRHKLPFASLDGELCSAGAELGLRLLGRGGD